MCERRLGPSYVATACQAIWERLVRHGFCGWDPYDALNGRRLPPSLVSSPLGRRLTVQAVKRCPRPMQPLIGVAPEVDAYTLGHALLGCARLFHAGRLPSAAEHAMRLARRLEDMAVNGAGTVAWGYHFPVHTRFFSYESSTPNLIVTAFVAKGFAEATRAGLLEARDDLAGAVRFILEALPRTTDATGQCFGYVPGEPAAVHNANLLAALVLCEAAELCGEEAWVGEALSCARFTVARQAGDGSWPYSEEPYGRWIDGFHTGFVLEGLARVVRATGDAALRRSLERGLAFYVAQLFGPRGEPKYYPHRAWPLDALSAAQGVETLQVALAGPAGRAVPGQLEWICRHLVRPDGRVAYQVHRGWTDWREFPRWSSAPLMSALAGVAAGSEDLA
jgi:polysaccharide biosynthesis protein VpsJ